MPIEYLIQLCGRQRPREFSISGYQQNKADMTMAVTEYETKFKRQKQGICSYWLKQQGEDPVPIWLKNGTMTFNEGPLIMVGPGTGVAVFRSLI